MFFLNKKVKLLTPDYGGVGSQCKPPSQKVRFGSVQTRFAESESESPGVVATCEESESESESIKLPRYRLRNVLFESVI